MSTGPEVREGARESDPEPEDLPTRIFRHFGSAPEPPTQGGLMATISGAESPHLLRVLGRFWYVRSYGEVHAARAAAADCEAA